MGNLWLWFYLACRALRNHEQEAEYMNEISELDLQNLRHLIGGFDTTHCKMDEYARQATDAQVKQFSRSLPSPRQTAKPADAVFTVGGGTHE